MPLKVVHVLLFLFAVACCSFSPTVAFTADGISLQTLGQITGQALSFSLTRDGRVLYLVDFIAGLRVIDVSDPIEFDVIENVATPGRPQYGALSLDESKLFIADGHEGLAIFDVRNPRFVVLASSFAIPGSSIDIVRVASNDMVFVSQVTGGIKAIDVSSVISPTITQNVSLTWNSFEYSAFRLQVSANGSVLCALAKSSSDESTAVRLFIFSRADVNSDLTQAYSTEVNYGEDIALTRDGRYLFMTIYVPDIYSSTDDDASTDASFSNGLHRFDLATPSNPILVRPSALDTTSPLVSNARATEDGAWLVYLNSDETRLYVESNEFAVFELDTNRNVKFAAQADLRTSDGREFYPALVVESPDGGILYAGAGFGVDAIALLSLSSTATLNITSTTAVDLISSTNRIGLMTVDGSFALFIQRDPSGSGDKGKLTAFEIGTASSVFTFVLDIAWAASDVVMAKVTQTQLFVTNYGERQTTAEPSGATWLKYEFSLTTLSTLASRVKSTPPPAPPAILSPPSPVSLINGSVRLVDGDDQYSGRVELYYSGSWGTVCDDAFGLEEGEVICQQLFGTSVVTTYSGAYYGQGSGPIYLDDLACLGTESALGNCQMTQRSATPTWSWLSFSYEYTYANVAIDGSSIGKGDCGHYEDASVQCAAPTASSSQIPVGDIRLVSGLNEFEGRVEIYDGSSWGTVCDDSFDMSDAEVVCRQVGGKFSNGIMKAFNFDTSVPGSGTIHLDDVACAGTESRLIDCPANNIGSHNCVASEDVYVRCVHEILTPANTYQFVDGANPDASVFDEVSKTWYAQTLSSGPSQVEFTAMKFAQSNAPTTSYLNIPTYGKIVNVALSGDRRAIFILGANGKITTVDVTNVASMKTHSLSNFNSLKSVQGLMSSPSRGVMVSVHSSSLLILNTSIGLNADIIGSYVPTCSGSSDSFDVRINGDVSRILVSHPSCTYSELIDSRTLRAPRIIAAIDVIPSSHVDAVFHNETSYFVFAKDSSSGTHDVRQGKIERQDVDMVSAPTRVGITLSRYVTTAPGVTISSMKLAGTSDDLSVAGLSFSSNHLSGVVDKLYAGRNIDLLLAYTVGGYNRHAVFSVRVDSTIRASVASSVLTLSSPEPLLQLTLEIPDNVAASFVTKDELGVQYAQSNYGHVLSLFGVQATLNEALSKIRYHSRIAESLIREQPVKATVTDLLSPELELGELGVPNLTLSNFNYNAHPYLTVQAIPDLRFTIGDRFTFAFNESLFTDDDDATLAYSLRASTDVALPLWLDFDAADLQLTGSVDSALASSGRVFNPSQNRYELVVPLKLSATDGYATNSSIFQLIMYNYPPRTLVEQVTVDITIGAEQTVNMSSYFQDEDLNAGGSLEYSLLNDQGSATPPWIKIDQKTGSISVVPSSGGSFNFKVSASDGVNDAVHVLLSVHVKRTELLMFYYVITLTLTALGGLSSVFAAYKYVWIVKNIMRSKKNWPADVRQVRSIAELEALITSYRIRVGNKNSELVDRKAVYSLQMVQLLPPKWYFYVLSPSIRKWLSCEPLRDGRAIPTWLEIDKNHLTFAFLKRAFELSIESGMHYVLLIKEKDGSTIDTLDIDLTLVSDGIDEELGGQVAGK